MFAYLGCSLEALRKIMLGLVHDKLIDYVKKFNQHKIDSATSQQEHVIINRT